MPRKSIEYYKEVENKIGDREDTQEFFRLFMIPGMDHCGIGKDLEITNISIDPLSVLEKWVEKVTHLTAVSCGHDQFIRTVYNGESDVNLSSSYQSMAP